MKLSNLQTVWRICNIIEMQIKLQNRLLSSGIFIQKQNQKIKVWRNLNHDTEMSQPNVEAVENFVKSIAILQNK